MAGAMTPGAAAAPAAAVPQQRLRWQRSVPMTWWQRSRSCTASSPRGPDTGGVRRQEGGAARQTELIDGGRGAIEHTPAVTVPTRENRFLPFCGAPVEFKSTASLYAVCEYCRSTLLRHGEDLENLGRMADLFEDASLIQLGSEGKFRGVHFGVIGRIQLKHESGLWNEWHILFDDGRSAWLSEAGGEYVVNAQVAVGEAIPAFENPQIEEAVTLAGRAFKVTNLDSARCIAGEGNCRSRSTPATT